MIKDRILEISDYSGLTKELFFSKIGMTTANFRGKAKETPINSTAIENILSVFPEINPEWLITGKGNMLKDTSESIEPIKKDNQENIIPAKPTSPSDPKGIPLIPTSAMAGIFSGEMQVLEYECERFVIPTFKDADFLIAIKGTSMYPKYHSGDLVACKKLPIDTFFQWNKVYVLDTEQGALIKRVKQGSNPQTLSIHSDNPNYPPFELDLTKIFNIALVVGVIRLE